LLADESLDHRDLVPERVGSTAFPVLHRIVDLAEGVDDVGLFGLLAARGGRASNGHKAGSLVALAEHQCTVADVVIADCHLSRFILRDQLGGSVESWLDERRTSAAD
jgi:hypothetical protein